jgi:4-hydroxy-2-oxoheptanedioate aldolase
MGKSDQPPAHPVNFVRQRFAGGELALGTYVTMPTGRAIAVLADAGLDFVRLDPFRFPLKLDTVTEMVAAARRSRMTPWARIGHDREAISALAYAGVQIITVPEIDTPAQAREVVSAVHQPPLGRRPVLASHSDEYLAWARSEILVGCQIETVQAIENFREIINVDGVDIIHTGRTDISEALGVPGEQFHPRVLEVERRIVEATLEAGKQPSLLYPLTDQGIELATNMARLGVRIFALDMDYRVLHRAFTDVSRRMRDADAANSK